MRDWLTGCHTTVGTYEESPACRWVARAPPPVAMHGAPHVGRTRTAPTSGWLKLKPAEWSASACDACRTCIGLVALHRAWLLMLACISTHSESWSGRWCSAALSSCFCVHGVCAALGSLLLGSSKASGRPRCDLDSWGRPRVWLINWLADLRGHTRGACFGLFSERQKLCCVLTNVHLFKCIYEIRFGENHKKLT